MDIEKKSKYGVRLVGKEISIRNAQVAILQKLINNPSTEIRFLVKYFPEKMINEITNILTEIEKNTL